MDDLTEIILGVLAFLGVLFVFGFIIGEGLSSNNVTAEQFCESHGLELDYFEGSLTKIVCKKRIENDPNQRVFDFED